MTDGATLTADAPLTLEALARQLATVPQMKALMEPPAHPLEPWPVTPEVVAAAWWQARSGQPKLLNDLVAELAAREQRIKAAVADPFRHGYRLRGWAVVEELWQSCNEVAIFGANRSAKTEYASWLVARTLVEKPGAIVWCLCETHETSVRGGGQQQMVWKYLPAEWRAAAGKRNSGLNYSLKNKFSENAFIAPNGSECRFMNYAQDIKVIEGGQVDLWWADELCPVSWFLTLGGRTIDRRGKGLVTFTPIYGYNDTVGEFTQGSTVVEWADCPHFPAQQLWPGGAPGKVPFRLRCEKPGRAAVYFQMRDNPFVDMAELDKRWNTSATEIVLRRLYGVATKRVGNRFPKFGPVNLVKPERIPKEGTNYHVMDFAWARNWAMLWLRVERVGDGKERIYVYREWPDQSFGEWVVPGDKPNGVAGPAQAAVGNGIREYRQMIRALEGEEEIFLRYGDPRSGAAEAVTREDGGTSILSLLAEEEVSAPGLHVVPAKGVSIEEGVNIINEWLDWDDSQPVTVLNEPKLFISEECKNTIACLRLWTGTGPKEQQASKDFVDLLRYAAVMQVSYVDERTLGAQGNGWGY